MQTVKANMVPQLLTLYLAEQPIHKYSEEHIITSNNRNVSVYHAADKHDRNIL